MKYLKLDDYRTKEHETFWEEGRGHGEQKKTIRGYLITWGDNLAPGTYAQVWALTESGWIKPLKTFWHDNQRTAVIMAENFAKSMEPLTGDNLYNNSRGGETM